MALILQKEFEVIVPETVHNHDYMETKKIKMGHLI